MLEVAGQNTRSVKCPLSHKPWGRAVLADATLVPCVSCLCHGRGGPGHPAPLCPVQDVQGRGPAHDPRWQVEDLTQAFKD